MYTVRCCYPGTLEVFATNYPEAYKEAQKLANTYKCKVNIYPLGEDLHCFQAFPQYLDLHDKEPFPPF